MTQNSFKYFRKGDCPVCSGERRDCRGNDVLTFCRSANPSNLYTMVGVDRGAGFPMYKLQSEIDHEKSRSKQEWEQQRQREWEARQRAERERIEAYARGLSIEERDREFRKLFAQLTLLPSHRDNLKNRGLTDAQIELFRSIQYGKKLAGTSDRLPGVKDGAWIGASGYFCPAFDLNGYIVGVQVYTGQEGKKYVWVKNDRVSSHLQNGELPITVVKGSNEIGICEGLLKPYVASKRHGMTILGAAGGMFDKSQSQLLDTLNSLTATLKDPTITLYPDKNSVTNKDVYSRNCNLIHLITGLGFKIRVADWGQLWDKTKGDIDEIPRRTRINYLTSEEYLKIKNEVFIPKGFTSFIDSLINPIKKAVLFARQVLGFGDDKSGFTLYSPGNLPEYKPGLKANFRFLPIHRKEIYEEAARKGWKTILDTSQTGSGKSHGVAKLTASGSFMYSDDVSEEEIPLNRFFYMSQSPRNPSTKELENDFTELATRNDGMAYAPGKQTPLGNPVRVRAKEGMLAISRSNCHWADKFQFMQSRGLDTEGLCGKCPFNQECRVAIGEGYGFRYEMKEALSSEKIRGHITGISPDMVSNNDILIVDEYSVAMQPIITMSVTAKDINKTFSTIASKNEKLARDVAWLQQSLNRLSDRVSTPAPKFGWDHLGLIAILGNPPEDVGGLAHRIEEFFKDPENAPQLDKIKEAEGEQLDEILLKNWLVDFIAVWRGLARGSLWADNNSLVVNIRNKRLLDTIGKFHASYFQDATGSRYELSLFLDKPEEDILHIRQQTTEVNNLTIKQIIGLGKAGKDRSEDCDRRIAILVERLTQLHKGNIGFIDWKNKGKDGWLSHFSDGRGSNAFEKKEAVASFGAPYQQLSALQNTYQAFTKSYFSLDNAPELFKRYIEEKLIAEIVQEIGRLRANRRPGEELTYYLCCDVDTDFLVQRGFKVEQIDAFLIDPEAGDIQQRVRYIYKEAFKHLAGGLGRELASNITLTSLAEASGKTKGTLSTFAKKFSGGWEQFKECLIDLIYIIKGQSNTDVMSAAEAQFIGVELVSVAAAQSDETLIEEIAMTLDCFGRAGIQQVARYVPLKLVSRLVAIVTGTGLTGIGDLVPV